MPVNFSRQIDEVTAINLASVSGLFATFKYQINAHRSRQMIPFYDYFAECEIGV